VKNMIKLALRALLWALVAASPFAIAQNADFPNKPIKWVVGYPAGGGTDFLARTVAAQMSVQLNQSIVVDNRPGAAAIIGADIVAKSAGDGYTVFSADNGVLVYNAALYKKLPYDPVKDFAPIGLMARAPLMLVAAPNAGIKNARELLEKLKANPGKYSYGSPGNGSPHHLAMELLKSRLGLFVVHVPYRGAAPALQDVMGGQIPLMMIDTSSAISGIKSGKIVPLVLLSDKRIAQLPEVPTMVELGYKDVVAYAWQGLVVPASTPKDVQAKLNTAMQAALGNAAVKAKLYDAAWEPVPSDGATMASYVVSEIAVWHKLIRERGISLE